MIELMLAAQIETAGIRCWEDLSGRGGSICTEVRAGYGCFIARGKYWRVGVGRSECWRAGGSWVKRDAGANNDHR